MAPRLILFFLLIHGTSCVSADETNFDSLKKDFEEFRETAKTELAAHKHCLENLFTTLQPLVDQLRVGKTPAANFEKILNISSAVKSLGDIVDNFNNVNSTLNALSITVEEVQHSQLSTLADIKKLANRTQTLNNTVQTNSEAISELRRPFSNCGGYVELSGTNEIIYQIPQGVTRVNCIWVVWAKTTGPIRVSNLYNQFAQFGETFKLQVKSNFTKYTTSIQYIPLGEEREMILGDIAVNLVYVFFTANPTKEQQGIHVKFSDSGSKSTTGFRPKVKFMQFDRITGSFKYPPGTKSNYDNNERVFMIGHVPEGKSLRITIKTDLEKGYDFVTLDWGNGTRSDTQGFRFSGVNSWSSYTVPEGTSYLWSFTSDGSTYRSGFEFNYSYNENSEWL